MATKAELRDRILKRLGAFEGASTEDQADVESDIEDAIAELLELGVIGFMSADIPSASLNAMVDYVASLSADGLLSPQLAAPHIAKRDRAEASLRRINRVVRISDQPISKEFF